MKKNLFAFTKIYLIFMMLSVISYSCCEDTFQIRSFEKISFFELDDQYQETPIETITKSFRLYAEFSSDVSMSNLKLELTQSAYATSCAEKFINELLKETLIISIDKDFVYNGNTIPANSNLIDIPEVKDQITFYYSQMTIDFTDDFINNAQFENQEYVFTIYIETSDGLKLEKNKAITIDY